MSEEVFNALPFHIKIKKLIKQACRSVNERKVQLICFIGCGITKLYAVLFSTFWLLYICSSIGTEIETEDDAKQIYSNVMIVSVVLGLLLVPVVGRVADLIDPRILLPSCFSVRALAIVAFMYIQKPNSIYSYGVSVLLVLGTVMENVTVDVVLMRNADKQIRGVIYGIAVASGYVGQMIFSAAAGILFDR